LQLVQALKFEVGDSGLSRFLIDRSVANAALGTSFHWYLMIECTTSKMYAKVAFQFQARLDDVSTAQRDVLRRQGELLQKLSVRASELRMSKDSRSKKVEKLRSFLSESRLLPTPLPLPLNANMVVTSIAAERSSVFKSNLFPLLLWFNTADGDYPVIFKNGDDLRQDQLVIQLFTLMDRLLRRENLDLRLSPYSVLATGPVEGMIQFVPSKSLAAIMQEHGSLQNYLRQGHADEGALGSYGIDAGVMDTFVRSCGEV
jgi:phosphatidylinositol 3-kinase